jgi:hypothetical protein
MYAQCVRKDLHLQVLGHHLQRDMLTVSGFHLGENIIIRAKTILPKKHYNNCYTK